MATAAEFWRKHRTLIGFGLIVAGYVILAAGLIGFQNHNADRLRENSRAACERLNTTRSALVAGLLLDSRHAIHDQRYADSAHFLVLRQKLIDSIQPRDGGLTVDCRKAYP